MGIVESLNERDLVGRVLTCLLTHPDQTVVLNLYYELFCAYGHDESLLDAKNVALTVLNAYCVCLLSPDGPGKDAALAMIHNGMPAGAWEPVLGRGYSVWLPLFRRYACLRCDFLKSHMI